MGVEQGCRRAHGLASRTCRCCNPAQLASELQAKADRLALFASDLELLGIPLDEAKDLNEAALRTLHGGSSELTTVALEDDAASHRAHAFYERSILPAVVAGWSAIADGCAATRDARAWRGQLALLAGWDRLLDGCGEGAEDAREVALLREALRR